MINVKINHKNHKIVIALILASLMITSAFMATTVAFLSGQSGISGADYITMEGVAGNDYYDSRQYSYNINQWAAEYAGILGSGQETYPAVNPANMWFNASKSLRVGMTEFGEFATPANTGIAYGMNSAQWTQTESWASTAINQALLIQGWVFYMNYSRAAVIRAIEGFALYSDLSAAEAGRRVVSWDGTKAVGASGWSPVLGSLTTSGIKVLYDSARLGVARTDVVIHDGFYNEDVAKITLTVVLNKDTKYMIVYKDIKMLLDPKVLDKINDLAFSERYEIDLSRNLNPSNQAFIHYYNDYDTTVYQHPLTGQTTYSALQAYDSGKNNILFAAYWPQTTEYSVYNPLVPFLPIADPSALANTRVLPVNTAVADIPPSPTGPDEPSTPWVIAQWRYQSYDTLVSNYKPNLLQFLAKSAQREIRFVEVAGMTDYNNPGALYNPFRAQDADDSAYNVNYVDAEVQYLLEQVFNPEDLTTANDKTMMWLGLGQSSATTDSAGAVAMTDFENWDVNGPLGLFDRADDAFPWSAPVIGMKGTIPQALSNTGNFANYIETFSNAGKGTGTDATTYVRTGLNGFAFFVYDDVVASPPQPIAGGLSRLSGSTGTGLWYPSKMPLSERWAKTGTNAFSSSAYDSKNQEGIVTLGGMKANGITRYFNDFYFAVSREGNNFNAVVNGGAVAGSAPTSNGALPTIDYFPISTWNTGAAATANGFGYKEGYAVIAMARDINGTKGLAVYGWDGRDTYWASAWASQYLGSYNSWIPAGATAIILNISYSGTGREPTGFTVVKTLGTITEFGTNAFATAYTYDNLATWTGAYTIVALPGTSSTGEWWYAKLPTTSTAKVDFDP